MHPEQARTKFFTIVAEKGGTVIGEYVGTRTPVLVRCDKGHEWEPLPTNVTSHDKWCSTCRASKGEAACLAVLTQLGITPIPQYKIPGQPYPYDFYFHHDNIHYLLEYDGEQHFDENDFFDQRESLQERQQRDKYKTSLSYYSGYYLIRIDYTKLNQIETCIKEALTRKERLCFSTPTMYQYCFDTP